MSNFLTDKQFKVLEIIKQYYIDHEEAPTLEELKGMIGIKTKRGVVKHLDALEKKGYLNRSSKARGISIISNYSNTTFNVPVVGYANAGQPLVIAEEDIIGSIKVDKEIIRNNENIFALIVKGDSMNMKTIDKVNLVSNNYVIIRSKTDGLPIEYVDGDVVLAIIDNAATIKCFKKSQNSIILYPQSNNPIHTPIYLKDEAKGFINGKVIAVLENPLSK